VRRILVFPCGSEIGLEIHRAVGTSAHFHLVGASSVEDHGRFVYDDYIGGLPMVDDPELVQRIRRIVTDRSIDAIYPAMDSVIAKLKAHEEDIGCRVISPDAIIAETCLSKRKTYAALWGTIRLPKVYGHVDEVDQFPVFLKPEIGYGSRGVCTAYDRAQALAHLSKRPDCMILEHLPGEEYTVDCFTSKGEILFVGPRERRRVVNGISVNTRTMESSSGFSRMAEVISVCLSMDGAWFFQVKRASDGSLALMEVACRFAGSSSVQRARGVNLPLLSIYNSFGEGVSIKPNNFPMELDRAVSVRFSARIDFESVYVDYDDTLVSSSGDVNAKLVSFLFYCVNAGKRIVLLTRHRGDLDASLKEKRLTGLFDQVIRVQEGDRKSDRIVGPSIFIDDSHRERTEVMDSLGIPVFAPEAVVDLIVAHPEVQNF